MNPLTDQRAMPLESLIPVVKMERRRVVTALGVIMAAVPLVVAVVVPAKAWMLCLWAVAATVSWVGRGRMTRTGGSVALAEIERVVARFALATIVLMGAVALAAPARLFDWPSERPELWLSVVVAYPILSVLPQELIYRRWLFERLQSIGAAERHFVWLSAVAFGLLHALFRNVPAVALTLVGGWFFADTFRRTGSLWLVCVEHALYGLLIFTIGLGDFFIGHLPNL